MPTPTSYNTPGKTQNNAAMPKPGAHLGEVKGKEVHIVKDWWRYLLALTSPPQPENAVTVGASPTTYTASVNGTMLVTGGTGVVCQLKRVSAYTVSAGLIPMSVGDSLSLTYTAAPTLVWFPR